MTRPSLDACFNKVHWAKAELQSLADAVSTYFAEKPYTFVCQHDDTTGWNVFRLKVLKSPPSDLSIRVANIANNLRSALDNTVWQLWLLNGQDPAGKRTEFPVFKDRKLFDQRGRRSLAGMRDDHAFLVEAAQPYHRGKGAKTNPLWVLHERFWNEDKHRVPLKPVLVPEETEFGPAGSFTASDAIMVDAFTVLGRPIDEGAEVGRARIVGIGPNPHVEMSGQFPGYIALEDGTRVLALLGHAGIIVEGLLIAFSYGFE